MSSDSPTPESSAPSSGPSALELEKQQLRELNQKPLVPRYLGYVKLSGPGWLQSALTLGGGSLASGLYLGVLTGYSLLWLQPLAMILGIIMLAALSYLTLSTGERTFRAINYHVSPVLGWGWLIGSMMANMVWALPQYSLAVAAIKQNLLPSVFGEEAMSGTTSNLILVPIILAVATVITWSYGSGHWGVRLYERMLKVVVALIVLCFVLVVGRIVVTDPAFTVGDLFAGFIPSPSSLTEPPEAYQSILAEIEEPSRTFWYDYIMSQQVDVAMAAFATAVGINMTFLLAYSMLGRNWGREHRTLSIFDLSTGMFIPFLLATTCVVVSAGNRFHSQPYYNLLETVDGTLADGESPAPQKAIDEFNGLLKQRVKKDILNEETDTAAWSEKEWEGQIDARMATDTISDAEKRLASTLVKRDSFDLSRALEPLFQGKLFADIIFGLGVLGMAMSTISLLMLVAGFCVCEALNVPSTGWPFRLGTLAAATGALGPFFWGQAAPYLAIPTSVFGIVLLPIAYASFFFLMNSKSYMKDELPKGNKKVVWNVLMLCATTTSIVASCYAVWTKTGYVGIVGMLLFIAAALVTRRKHA
ncbi:MAG: hypothetical protein CMJ46_08155 [Planctomyces sp.]|nr:hypothetical protein [Planctomyces sp.]